MPAEPHKCCVNSSLIGGQALANGGAILVGSNGVVLIRKDAASPFVLSNFHNAAGETPLGLTGTVGSSYRSPMFTVSLGLTLQSSWM